MVVELQSQERELIFSSLLCGGVKLFRSTILMNYGLLGQSLYASSFCYWKLLRNKKTEQVAKALSVILPNLATSTHIL